jgi:hypothetical protein
MQNKSAAKLHNLNNPNYGNSNPHQEIKKFTDTTQQCCSSEQHLPSLLAVNSTKLSYTQVEQLWLVLGLLTEELQREATSPCQDTETH